MLKRTSLKTKSFLMKKTPLKSKNKGLKVSSFLKSNFTLKKTGCLKNKGTTLSKETELKKQSDKTKERWEKIRTEIILRDKGKCQLCGKPGSHVHHILLRSKRKDLLYNKNNLILLCSKCHNHSSTEGYMELSYKIAIKKGITIEELFKQAEKEN